MYSKGICWIDDCRIPFAENDDERIDKGYSWNSKAEPFGEGNTIQNKLGWNTQGRFPANILVCDDMLNDGVISKSGNNKMRSSEGFNKNAYGIGIGVKVGDNNGEYGDKGTNSRYYDIDKWFDKILND
jgi:hypothetical protein